MSGLLSELGSASGRRIATGDSLDRDLGLGSLERVELLLRIEHAFGVRLADDVMVTADIIADLATAVLAGAAPDHMVPAGPRPERPPRCGRVGRSGDVVVLARRLPRRAEHRPVRPL